MDSDKPPTDGFKILEVIRKAGDPLGTVVRMKSGIDDRHRRLR